jgi:hypothetical protein
VGREVGLAVGGNVGLFVTIRGFNCPTPSPKDSFSIRVGEAVGAAVGLNVGLVVGVTAGDIEGTVVGCSDGAWDLSRYASVVFVALVSGTKSDWPLIGISPGK